MISIHRSEQRFRTDAPGITSWHSFSSGAHYDPDNVAFGPVIACDEHLLDPGAGFERHPHAGVELISWVLDGALRHEDASGRSRIAVVGQVQYQLAGTGIEHVERNASDSAALHFVQLWLLTDEQVPDYDLGRPPAALTSGSFTVLRRCHDHHLDVAGSAHLFVAAGRFSVVGDSSGGGSGAGEDLRPGDSVRVRADSIRIEGSGELLVVTTVEV